MKEKTEWINIEDGLAIFKKPNSSRWYFWIKFEEAGDIREFRKTTRLKDQKEATTFALKEKIKLDLRLEANVPIMEVPSSITAISKKVLKEVELRKGTTTRDYKNHINQIVEMFKIRPLISLKSQDIKDYLNHYQVHSPTQIQNARYSFNLLYNFAIDNNYIGNEHRPRWPTEIIRNKKEVRDYFTDQQLKIIFNNFSQWKENSRKQLTRDIRERLSYLMVFLLNSGLRAGFETQFKFGDLRITKHEDDYDKGDRFDKHQAYDGRNYVSLKVKKGKYKDHLQREIPLNVACYVVLEHLTPKYDVLDMTYQPTGELANHSVEDTIEHQPNIEPFKLGHKHPDYASSFGQYITYLKDKDLLPEDGKFTLYSFRHTYATKMIIGLGNPDNHLTYEDIAKAMGSSVDMLHHHYDHIVSLAKSEHLVSSQFTDF